ncbi:hypothetical protein [Haloferula sargassicola]|uniref:Uncharacterized protein n=1 Tax=Haloferula sargassicola TaxID=490096 RepID=A0ABP9UKN0_9BACT
MIRLVFAILLTCGICHALDVRFLAWDDDVAARQIVALSGSSGTEISGLHPLKRTEAVSMTPAEGELAFNTPDKLTDEGKAAEMKVALGDGIKRPLVILLPDPKAPTGLRGFALNDNTDAFAWGSYRIINATPKVLNLAMGKHRLRLPTGWKAVDVKGDDEESYPIWMATADNPQETLYTNVWPSGSDIRRLVFIVPGTDPRLGPLALKIIPEDRRALE